MCIFSQLFIVFPFLGHPVWLKHPLNKFIYVFGSKGSQKARSQNENNYRRPTLLIEVNTAFKKCTSGSPFVTGRDREYTLGCVKKSKSLKISLSFQVGMGIAITKTHTKFEDLIFKIGKVPAILRFDQFYKGNCLKMSIFSHIFLFWP